MRHPLTSLSQAYSGYGDLYLEALLHDPSAAGINLGRRGRSMPHRCRRLDELKDRGVPMVPTIHERFIKTAAQNDDAAIRPDEDR
jgi:hypothetical protein